MHSFDLLLLIIILIFLSSLISIKLGVSVAIIEIFCGLICGSLNFTPDNWMIFIASLGGIFLTFLAGTEVDIELFKNRFKQSLLIGLLSFLLPFIGGFIYTYFFIGWSFKASLLTGTALSSTSIAVIYSVLVETGLTNTETGKMLMSCTFITSLFTAIALSTIFLEPGLSSTLFFAVSIILIYIAAKFSHYIFDHPSIRQKVIEPEIKYIFLLLILFVFLAQITNSQAILPAFILGLSFSSYFKTKEHASLLKNKLRTVAYSFITPLFFIVAGMKASLNGIISSLDIFIVLFLIKILGKFIGVHFLINRFFKADKMYSSLLMTTGLTFGAIACLFGLKENIITAKQYSVIIGVVILSAIIPTFIAQSCFLPSNEEDLLLDE